MSRAVTEPRSDKPKIFPLSIPPELALDLHDFCEVTAAQWTRVINLAIRDHIQKELRDNPGIKAKVEGKQRQRRNAQDRIRIVR